MGNCLVVNSNNSGGFYVYVFSSFCGWLARELVDITNKQAKLNSMNPYLTVQEVLNYHPIFAKRGKRWVYREIRTGKLTAQNISQPGYSKRYLITRESLDSYLENLGLK